MASCAPLGTRPGAGEVGGVGVVLDDGVQHRSCGAAPRRQHVGGDVSGALADVPVRTWSRAWRWTSSRARSPPRPSAISTTVVLPRLPSWSALGAVLAHREEIALAGEPGTAGVWDDDALVTLFRRYDEARRPLRLAMSVAHAALAQAVLEDAEQVEPSHVEWGYLEMAG